MEVVKKYWKNAVMIAALVTVVWQFYDLRALAQSHDDIIKGQHKISVQNQKMIQGMETELELMFRLGAITTETFTCLRELPRSPMDSLGNMNTEWYLIGEDKIYLINMPDTCDIKILEIDIG
jgi:hypothetical protein